MMGGRRNYKKRVLRQIPYPKRESKCIRALDTIALLNPTKSISSQLITNIERGEGDNQREDNEMFISGLKIRCTVRNNESIPLWFHMAIVSPKDPYPDNASLSNTPFSLEFFFSPVGTAGDKAGVTPSSSLTGMDWGTLPINSDRHNVIWHMRKSLGVRFNTTTQPFTTGAGIPNYFKLSRYIRINKKINYANGAPNTCRQPMFLIWWASQYEEPAGTGVVNAYVTQTQLTTYFRDIKK